MLSETWLSLHSVQLRLPSNIITLLSFFVRVCRRVVCCLVTNKLDLSSASETVGDGGPSRGQRARNKDRAEQVPPRGSWWPSTGVAHSWLRRPWGRQRSSAVWPDAEAVSTRRLVPVRTIQFTILLCVPFSKSYIVFNAIWYSSRRISP